MQKYHQAIEILRHSWPHNSTFKNKTKDWALVHERELFRSDEYVVFGGLEIEWLENRRLLV